MSRPAPYAKAVRECALDCLDSGLPQVLDHVAALYPAPAAADIKVGAQHRLLIFVGPTAWAAAKWYLDRGAPAERRAGYVLVLPPDETLTAPQMRWPVERRAVVLVDTGAGLRQLEPLVDALRRDGAIACWWYEVQRDFAADDLEWGLQRLHAGDPVAPMVPWERDYMAKAA